MMGKQAIKNREQIAEIKRRYAVGELSYNDALAEAQPIVEAINERGRSIAKKYKASYKPVSAREMFR